MTETEEYRSDVLVVRLGDPMPEPVEYYRRVLQSSLDALKTPKPEPVRKAAAGRNDPCPCGSGKKYKKCCLTGDAK